MATKLGTISVDLRANIAQFKSDLDAASANTARTMGQISATMKAQTTEGAQALRFFAASADINVSRPLARVLAQTSLLGPALAASFGVGAGVALASVVTGQLLPAFKKVAEYVKSFSDSTEETKKPLADLNTLKERSVALEHELQLIGKDAIAAAKLKLQWANELLAVTTKQYTVELTALKAKLELQKATLAAASEVPAGDIYEQAGVAVSSAFTQKRMKETQAQIEQIELTLKNLSTSSAIAGANLSEAIKRETEKALTPLQLMGLEMESIGHSAEAALGKVQGLLPKDELGAMETELRLIAAQLSAIADFTAAHPTLLGRDSKGQLEYHQTAFVSLNAEANKLLSAQKAISEEYARQLDLLNAQVLAEIGKNAKFPEGVMAGPVSRIPVGPGVQSGADFERIKADIAAVNDLEQRGLITTEEARRRVEHLREEWDRLAMQTDKTWAGINAGLREFSRQMGTLQQQIGFATLGALRNMHSSFTRFFTDIAMGTKGIGEAFAELGRNIVASIAEALAEMLANWIMTHVIMAAVSKIFGDDIGNAAAQKQKNQQMASSDAFRAAAGTLALASENYLFPLPLILAAITLGVGQSFAAAAGKAKGGLITGSGFGDTVPAMLSPGEYVLSAPAVRGISVPVLDALNSGRGMRSSVGAAVGGGGGGGTYNNYVSMPTSVSALDADGVDQVLNKHRTKIYRAMLAEIKKRGGGGFRN